jgi:hypothetical protein
MGKDGAKTLDNWPRLSETLAGPRAPDRCQSCGLEGTHSYDRRGYYKAPELRRWREHSQFDKPEPIIVILCAGCSDRLIEKHKRLYSHVNANQPEPGTEALCLDCPHREGVACRCPLLTSNGGPGMLMTCPKPSDVHFLRRGKGARSGWEKIYPGPPEGCAGKEAPCS